MCAKATRPTPSIGVAGSTGCRDCLGKFVKALATRNPENEGRSQEAPWRHSAHGGRRGYLVNSASRLTVTLPARPAVGDTFEVSGIGGGGWTIGQNAGQPSAVSGSSETFHSADGGRTWASGGLNFFRASGTATAADGSRFHTVGTAAHIYSSSTRTILGAGGTLSGGAYDTVALQYVGGGVFMPIRALGGRQFRRAVIRHADGGRLAA